MLVVTLWPVRLRGVLRLLTPARERAYREGRGSGLNGFHFQHAFEGVSVGVTMVSLQGRILDANTALEAMLGYTSGELRGMSVTDLTHPDDYRVARKLFWELLSGDRDHYRIEKRYLRKDGSIGKGLLIVALVRDVHGRPRHILGLLEELS